MLLEKKNNVNGTYTNILAALYIDTYPPIFASIAVRNGPRFTDWKAATLLMKRFRNSLQSH